LDSGKPIGIFDSGLGGLTVFREIRKILPQENIIYFGDTARLPYGTKTPEAVVAFAREIAAYLIGKGVKILVIACNTASAVAFGEVKKISSVPVVGILRPSVEKAIELNARKIVVIGTEATISSHQYKKSLRARKKTVRVVEKACSLFVPLIEEGWVNKKISAMIIREYLKSLKPEKCDVMILGCTHYPLLGKQIKKFIGSKLLVIDSARALAEKVEKTLASKNLLSRGIKKGKSEFFVSSNPQRFRKFAKKLLGIRISSVKLKRF